MRLTHALSHIRSSRGLLMQALTLAVLTGCPKPNREPVALTINPAEVKLARGERLQLVATAVFPDGSSRDVTSETSWSVDDRFVADMSPDEPGVVIASQDGITNIRARFSIKETTRPLTVSGASMKSLEVDPAHPIVPVGLQRELTVTAITSDDEKHDVTDEAVWMSASPDIATVEGNRLIAHRAGTTTLTVSVQGTTLSIPVDVTTAQVQQISVTPAQFSLATGFWRALSATAVMDDGSSLDVTRFAIWASSSNSVASFSQAPGEEGIITARALGTAQLSAAIAGKSGSAAITVTDAQLVSLELSPGTSLLSMGTSQRFEVTGVFSDGTSSPLSPQAVWNSSASSVLSIDSHGIARALTRGTSTLTASAGTLSVARLITVTDARVASLEFSPNPVTIARGLTADVKVFGLFTDGTRHEVTSQVVWSVADASKAQVSNAAATAGRVTAIAEGVTELAASIQGVRASVPLTISAAALTMVQLSPSAPTMPLGTSVQFSAVGLFSDGSTSDLTSQTTFSSSDASHVSISVSGDALAVGLGTATITASVGGKSASTIVTATDAMLTRLEVAPSQPMLPVGVSQRFTAQGVYSDGTVNDLSSQVTWSIRDAAIASVSNAPTTRGLVLAIAQGQTKLTASFSGSSVELDLTVTAANVSQLELVPATLSLPVGLTGTARVIATWTDGAALDVTNFATFTTDASGIATVSNAPASRGEVLARMPGQTRLVVTAFGLSTSSSIVVTPAVLSSLAIMPNSLSLAHGTFSVLSARATFSDGSNLDVTTQTAWSSSAPAIASLSNVAGHEGEVQALQPGSALARAQFGGQTATAPLTITPATLVSLELDPVAPTVPLGASQQFTLTGRYSDGSAQVLTDRAAWSSSAPGIASISNAPGSEGRLVALARGDTMVTASFSGIIAHAQVTISDATLSRVELTPPAPAIAKLTRLQLTATGVWTDGHSSELTQACTWSSASPMIATASNAPGQKGRVDALAAGSAVITATCSGVSGSITFTVKDVTLTNLVVDPLGPSAAAGFTQQLSATGIFSDGSSQLMTDQVTWGTLNASTAIVSNAAGSEGLVSALAPGSATLTVNALGVTHAFTFDVTAALLQSLDIAPVVGSVPNGLGLNLIARGHFSDGTTVDLSESCVWSTSQPTVASVSNAAGLRGILTSHTEGTTVITATTGGFSATSTITVSPAQLTAIAVTPSMSSVAAGLTLQFTAMGSFTDGTTRDLTTVVTWSVGDGSTASISNADGSRGLARGTRAGNTSVIATAQGQSGSTTLQVTSALMTSISVTPANLSIPRGLGAQLIATGLFTDGSSQDVTEQATWSSSDPLTLAVSTSAGSRGQSQALELGTVTVIAQVGATQGSTQLTVSAAVLQSIALTPVNPSVPAGLTTQLMATGSYSDATTRDLTTQVSWSSSNQNIAFANPNGSVIGFQPGTTTVSVNLAGVWSSATFTVTRAVLQQLQVTPPNAMQPRGLTQQFTAMGVFSDLSTQDLTGDVTWSSSDPARVAISNATGSNGLASTPGLGNVLITATLAGISNSTPFTVTAAQLTSVTITPNLTTAPLGSARQFFAVGHYTDGSSQNLTNAVTWGSSTPAVATISNAGGSKGLTTTLSVGSSTISAGFGGFNATAALNVIQSMLTRIDVTPANASTALGYTRQFIAVGTYNDGTTQVLTDSVMWSSSDDNVALISNAAGSRGLMSSVATGPTTISATVNGVTGSTLHTVSPAALVFIDVSPSSISMSNGASVQLTATGFFSDGSSQDLTTTVTWSSADPSVAQVSNASGSEGRVTGVSIGSTSVSATSGGVSASQSVSVN